MKICGPAKMRCSFKAENDLFLTGESDSCNCLPSCATITYDVESNQVDYDLLSAMTRSIYKESYDSMK